LKGKEKGKGELQGGSRRYYPNYAQGAGCVAVRDPCHDRGKGGKEQRKQPQERRGVRLGHQAFDCGKTTSVHNLNESTKIKTSACATKYKSESSRHRISLGYNFSFAAKSAGTKKLELEANSSKKKGIGGSTQGVQAGEKKLVWWPRVSAAKHITTRIIYREKITQENVGKNSPREKNNWRVVHARGCGGTVSRVGNAAEAEWVRKFWTSRTEREGPDTMFRSRMRELAQIGRGKETSQERGR